MSNVIQERNIIKPYPVYTEVSFFAQEPIFLVPVAISLAKGKGQHRREKQRKKANMSSSSHTQTNHSPLTLWYLAHTYAGSRSKASRDRQRHAVILSNQKSSSTNAKIPSM
jgi:hypothetical protein